MQGRKIVLFHIQAYGEPVDHLRIDHGGIDGVDANPLRGILESSGFRQSDDGVFRGNVNRHVREPNHPRTDEQFTMAPPPPSSIRGISYFMESHTPLTLTSMIAS